MPNDSDDKIMMFHRFVIRHRRNNSYLLSQIGNMDQTPLYFGMSTNTTNEAKGEKECNPQKWMQKTVVAICDI